MFYVSQSKLASRQRSHIIITCTARNDGRTSWLTAPEGLLTWEATGMCSSDFRTERAHWTCTASTQWAYLCSMVPALLRLRLSVGLAAKALAARGCACLGLASAIAALLSRASIRSLLGLRLSLSLACAVALLALGASVGWLARLGPIAALLAGVACLRTCLAALSAAVAPVAGLLGAAGCRLRRVGGLLLLRLLLLVCLLLLLRWLGLLLGSVPCSSAAVSEARIWH